MIIKALILSTLLNSDPMIVQMPSPVKIALQARRRNSGKGNKKRRRGGSGLR